ncbi:mitochondrial distribution and morphology protein 12 [Scheffersomyces amazonensis]|uniref:mitochondrial distribution and morphology protein 12 n=1 Tax=Scheffersomyces amazonensis TaxID=1078765 RepID=UPI00315D163C
MSFDINWEKLNEDESINESIKEFLDRQFRSISLPSYISGLSVNNFSLGDISPEVIVRHVGDPFEQFYDDEEEDEQDEKDEKDVNSEKSNGDNVVEDDDDDNDDDDEDYDDDDDDNEDDDVMTLGESNNLISLNQASTPPPGPIPSPPLLLGERTRNASDSVSLMLGTPSYLHNYNYNYNIIGLGTNTGGTETPTDILNQSALRTKSNLRIETSKKSSTKNDNDIQLILEIKYHGNAFIDLTANLLVNYPSPNFISLPIKLHITDLVIHSLATVAYLKNSAYFTFLCDIDDSTSDYFSSTHASTMPPNSTPASTSTPGAFPSGLGTSTVDTPLSTNPPGGNFVDYVTDPNNTERIDIIKKIKIESEIGQVQQNVLRNVGKVEKFLVEQIRKIIREEIAWPSWICFDMSKDDEADHDDSKEDDTNGESENN